jgi:fructokinase
MGALFLIVQIFSFCSDLKKIRNFFIKKKIVCFGETLWDHFLNGKEVGGAPLNVAVRASSLGSETAIISKIGNDEEGKHIIEFLKDKNVDTRYIQIDSALTTGKVKVQVNEKGSANYEIVQPSAWDNIEITPENIALVQSPSAFIFGSLTFRDKVSKQTLVDLLPHAHFKVFDVNLRPPFYDINTLKTFMQIAHFIKLNDDEMYELATDLGSNFKSLNQNIIFISEKMKTPTICVTKGKHGAVLYSHGKFYYNSGFNIKVVDTVGAGDSFLTTLIKGIVNNEDLHKALNMACAVGALVAGQKGATQNILTANLHRFMRIN